MGEIDKAKKLLFTIKYRYSINPNIIDSYYQSGKFPSEVEKEIEELIIGKKGSKSWKESNFSNSKKAIIQANYEVSKMIKNGKLTNINQLINKKWIYERLPKNISSYFKNYKQVN